MKNVIILIAFLIFSFQCKAMDNITKEVIEAVRLSPYLNAWQKYALWCAEYQRNHLHDLENTLAELSHTPVEQFLKNHLSQKNKEWYWGNPPREKFVQLKKELAEQGIDAHTVEISSPLSDQDNKIMHSFINIHNESGEIHIDPTKHILKASGKIEQLKAWLWPEWWKSAKIKKANLTNFYQYNLNHAIYRQNKKIEYLKTVCEDDEYGYAQNTLDRMYKFNCGYDSAHDKSVYNPIAKIKKSDIYYKPICTAFYYGETEL